MSLSKIRKKHVILKETLLPPYSGTDNFQTIFFIPETDESELVWRGPGSGVSAAVEIFRADQAFKNSDLKKFLGEVHRHSIQNRICDSTSVSVALLLYFFC